MICKLLAHYSLKGNTEGIINHLDLSDFTIINLKKSIEINLNDYDLIVFATSTYGRGTPPPPFFKIRDQLINLKHKKIGLVGSGRTEYEYFCGALDLLEEILKDKNEILFKFKFEGYPKDSDKEKFKKIMEEHCL